jgi:hypothetical protein
MFLEVQSSISAGVEINSSESVSRSLAQWEQKLSQQQESAKD